MMQTLVRGYSLVRQVYANELFRVCEASHSVLKGQQLRITVINNHFSEIKEVKSEFNASAFRLGFAEHPYIIRNIDMIEENEVLAILSEHIPLRDSAVYLEGLTLAEKMEFVMKILEALIYLNDRKIFHLSPEPEDILIDENNNPRLSNYGLADIFLKIKNEEDKEVVLSNFKFVAPELRLKNSCGDEKAEVFAFGMYLHTVFGDDDVFTKIVEVATNPDRNKRFRNLNDLEKVLIDPEKLNTFIPETVSEHKVQTDNDYEEKWEERKQLINEEINTHSVSEIKASQTDKNVFQILNEIENKKNPEPPKQTQATNVHQTQQAPPYQQQQKTQQATQYQQQKVQQPVQGQQQSQYQTNDYNRTREAIRQSASQQQNPINAPQPAINTVSIVVLGFLSVIFGFIFSLVGFVLAIVGFNNASANKKKAAKMGRKLTTSEVNAQTVGVVLCVIGLIVSIGKFLAFLGTTFG